MTFLILAIISSTINHLLFKAFARFRVNLLTALVINYAVCVFIGYGSSFNTLFSSSYFWQGWYPFSILQGGIFVACLFFMGQTTANHGVAVASLATRFSVAIPTFSAFFLYHDIATMPKVIGILLTLLALYFSSIDPKNPSHPHGILSLLPISLFLVFGAHSTLAKFVQHHFLVTTSYHTYVMSAFFSAFLICGLILVRKLIRKQHSFHRKDLVSGLALGFFQLRISLFPDTGAQCAWPAEFPIVSDD